MSLGMDVANCRIQFILVATCGKGSVTQQSTWTHSDLEPCKSFNAKSNHRGCRNVTHLDKNQAIRFIWWFYMVLILKTSYTPEMETTSNGRQYEELRLCDPQGCDFNAFGQLLDDDSEVTPGVGEQDHLNSSKPFLWILVRYYML